MTEKELFHSLFAQQVKFTLCFLASLTEQDWQIIANPWDSLFCHGLAKNVSVADIVKHIIMLENHLIGSVKSQRDGNILALDGDDTLLGKINKDRDIVNCYESVHEENLAKIHGISQSDLAKKLIFINQRYTGIGLLWMVTGHHAFHLGQLRSMTFSGG